MTRLSSLRIAPALFACLLPLQALAQSDSFTLGETPEGGAPPPPPPTNWITLGSQYNSAGGYYLGQYSGAVHPGFYGLGDFHVGQRDPWDSSGTFYWSADGANLGLPERSFNARIGEQGTWGLTFYYQGIPYYETPYFQSVYQTNGQLVPGISPGGLRIAYAQLLPRNGIVNSLWIPRAVNPATPLLFNYNLNTQRNIFGGTGKYQWGDWTFTGAWQHTHKTGWRDNSAVIGGPANATTAGTGANPPTTFTNGFAFFPQPIDYDYDRYEGTAAYSTEQLQVQLSYVFSNFNDNNAVFNAVNPFAFTPTTAYGGRINNVFSPVTGPPSNSANQVKAMIGYNFTPTTRLNANFGYEVDLQNAAFITGFGNPNLPTQVLPRNSFNGQMNNYFANAALTTMLMDDLDFRLAYTLDDRSNRSPSNI
jgi:MtrB/PioB family decaheme-associated outer membrane protein